MVKIVPVALFSACLAACGGGGNAVRPDPPSARPTPPDPSPVPDPGSSLSEVPEQYRDIVSREKTVPLIDNDDGVIYQYTLGGKTGEYNFSDLPNGIGATWTQDSGDEFDRDELNIFEAEDALGFSTPATALSALTAQDAIFTYKGSAFDGREEATLNYMMDFGRREGSGSIAGFASTGLITLRPSTLRNDGSVRGDAHIEKAPVTEPLIRYELSFFGPNAEELAGEVYDPTEKGFLGENEIIFAGKR